MIILFSSFHAAIFLRFCPCFVGVVIPVHCFLLWLLSVLDILTFYFQPHSAGHQGWLHLSNIINNAAMVILVSGLLWTYEQTPLKYMPRNEIVETKGDTRGHHIQLVLHRCIQPDSQWGLKNRPLLLAHVMPMLCWRKICPFLSTKVLFLSQAVNLQAVIIQRVCPLQIHTVVDSIFQRHKGA